MKYALYFEFYDGYIDSINVIGADTRDKHINWALAHTNIKHMSYSKIYKSGEYSPRTFIF